MDPTRQKENFSRAYVSAVAAAAGVSFERRVDDDDSVDGTLHLRGGGTKRRSPLIDAQLKCSAKSQIRDGHVRQRLKRKNYDDLRDKTYIVPRILIVVLVPEEPHEWLDQTAERMLVRKCGYWMSLKGHTAGADQTSVTVSVPCDQPFSVGWVREMMRLAGEDLFP